MSLGEPTIEQAPVAEQLGPYRLVRRLGQGGMGVVYLGTGPDDQQVAVKVLRPHVAHDPTARARLEREVSTLQRISHPGVAGVLDHDLHGDRPYLVTRYVPGPQLDDLVEERGPLTPRRLLMTAGCLAESLQAIHAVGVVHRDLKPGNVLMYDDRPVVIDFGIAQAADDLRITATGLVIGTPGYIAPELVAGEPVAASTDWWGWAATVAFAATGRRPFGTGPFEAVLARVRSGEADLEGIDPRLAPLLAASLSPDRAARPTAEEIMRGLDRYSEGRIAFVPRESPTVMSPAMRPDRTRVMPADGTKQLPATTGPTPEQVAALIPPMIPKRTPKPAGKADRAAVYHAGLNQPQAYQPGAYQPVAYQQPALVYPQSYPVPPAPAPAQQAKPALTSSRTGTLFSLLLALAAFAALAPALACIITGLLIVMARLVDRTSTTLLRRRQTRGGRGRSDGWVATLTSPVHLATSVLITIPCLILPLFMGLVTGGFAAIGGITLYGLDWQPLVAVACGVGAFIGLLTAWWGPGGSSLRRGSHSIARVAVRPVWLRAIVVVSLLSVAMVCMYLVLTGVDTSWAPISDPFDRSQLPSTPHLPDLPDFPSIHIPFIN